MRSRKLLAALLLGAGLWASKLPGALANDAMQTAQPSQAPEASLPLLRFSDFFKLPLGPRGLEMQPALLQAHGTDVRLVGYMVQKEQASIGQFMLTPRPVRMSEHADGDADDLPAAWVLVTLAPSQSSFVVPYQPGLLEVRGRLQVGREEATDGRVSWVRLMLEPNATRGMNAFELNQYLHSLQHRH